MYLGMKKVDLIHAGGTTSTQLDQQVICIRQGLQQLHT
jgi:hypothetical protein